MQLIKLALSLSLFGFSNCLLAMDEPGEGKTKTTSVKQYNLENEIHGVFQPTFDSQASAQRYEAHVNSSMAPYLKGFEKTAQLVCTDLKIKDGNYNYVKAGIRAPEGSVHRTAFDNFIIIIRLIDFMNQIDGECLSKQDAQLFTAMLLGEIAFNMEKLKEMRKRY